jgi:hypothetical protein
MKTIRSGSSLITVVINKSEKSNQVFLDFGGKKMIGNLLFANKNGKVNGNQLSVGSEETVVIEWKQE